MQSSTVEAFYELLRHMTHLIFEEAKAR
jgi:sugar diacid utilization regulator